MTVLPRAILFDLDETILTFGRRPQILAGLCEQFAAEIAPLAPADLAQALEAGLAAFWSDPERHRTGRMNLAAARLQVISEVFAALQSPGLTPTFARLFADRFQAYREEQARFFPGALETLVDLKRRGVKLALVTNGAAAVQRAKIERFDLADYFDHIQIEGEAGFGKPEDQAYRHALQALGVEARDAWMVGDNLDWEVVAPQRLGIYAIWHDHLGEGLPVGSPVKPDRIVRLIAELLESPS